MKTAGMDALGAADESRAGGSHELLEALAGKQADREVSVAQRTRRVVSASLGVLQEQKEGRKRNRSLALAALVLVLFAVGPLLWRVADDLIGGEHIWDLTTEVSLLVCVLCPALLAAALVAGWPRRKS